MKMYTYLNKDQWKNKKCKLIIILKSIPFSVKHTKIWITTLEKPIFMYN